MGFDAPDRIAMSLEEEPCLSCGEVPDAKGRISGSRDGKMWLLLVVSPGTGAAVVARVLWKLV